MQQTVIIVFERTSLQGAHKETQVPFKHMFESKNLQNLPQTYSNWMSWIMALVEYGPSNTAHVKYGPPIDIHYSWVCSQTNVS